MMNSTAYNDTDSRYKNVFSKNQVTLVQLLDLSFDIIFNNSVYGSTCCVLPCFRMVQTSSKMLSFKEKKGILRRAAFTDSTGQLSMLYCCQQIDLLICHPPLIRAQRDGQKEKCHTAQKKVPLAPCNIRA
jgi:hypothetical protein